MPLRRYAVKGYPYSWTIQQVCIDIINIAIRPVWAVDCSFTQWRLCSDDLRRLVFPALADLIEAFEFDLLTDPLPDEISLWVTCSAAIGWSAVCSISWENTFIHEVDTNPYVNLAAVFDCPYSLYNRIQEYAYTQFTCYTIFGS